MKGKGKLNKTRISVFGVIVFTVLLIYVLSLVLVLGWGVMTSLKDESDFMTDKLAFPRRWHFDNLIVAFNNIKFPTDNGRRIIYLEEMLGYSLIYSVGGAICATLAPCLVAYVVAKYKSPMNKVIYDIVIVTMIVPIVGNLPSVLRVLTALHLYDNMAGLLIMKFSFTGMYFLIFYATFKSVSWEYAEAALIDGAGHFKIMTGVMFPMARNTMGIVFLLQFIGLWNDYQTPLVYLPSMPTAAYGLYTYTHGYIEGSLQTVPLQLAGGVIILLPILILFLIFKDKVMGNISIGGLKG